ncbi:hypothetical protein N9878_00475, partial [bacterium]|nr:hypothetical protein [bacterium]
QDMFQDILDYAEAHDLVLDGEFNSSTLNRVGQTKSVLEGTRPCPDDFMFKCFYAVPYKVWNLQEQAQMKDLLAPPLRDLENYEQVIQFPCGSWEEFQRIAEDARDSNIEGFMALNPRGYWRHKRATINDCVLYKYKYYSDPIDAQIMALQPRKQLKRGLSSRVNPAGYAKAVHTQASFEETEMAGVMCCIRENGGPVAVPFPVGTDNAQKVVYMREFGKGGVDDLKGQWLQFRRLAVEDGGKAISIKDVEFRDSKGSVK